MADVPETFNSGNAKPPLMPDGEVPSSALPHPDTTVGHAPEAICATLDSAGATSQGPEVSDTADASARKARQEKAASRFKSLRPDKPVNYTFPAPRAPTTTSLSNKPSGPKHTGAPHSGLSVVASSGAVGSTEHTRNEEGAVSLQPEHHPSQPTATSPSNETRTATLGCSRAFLDAVRTASSLGGPLYTDFRRTQKAVAAREPARAKQRRNWTPGKGSETIAACGRDWVAWPENLGQKRTLDDFFNFAGTLSQAIVEQWCKNVVDQEDKDRAAAAQGRTVKAEGLGTLGT
ncbi:unnamed protein product [Peniophora sp. CBMAI 1063]|nr:unnamed protein product [Peniophora sp. CBMAI 1063]